MLIGELVARSGMTRDAIRFYEKAGLIRLRPSQRRSNNYKEYTEAHLRALLTVQRLKQLGFTLRESADLLPIVLGEPRPCVGLTPKLQSKLQQLERQIAEMQAIHYSLAQVITACGPHCVPTPCGPTCLQPSE